MKCRHTLTRGRAWPRACLAIALAIGLGAAGTAAAQDQAMVDRLVQMNSKALEDYDTLEFDTAKRTLLEALALGKKGGLDSHPIMARTYLHLGAVYITGFKDKQRGLQSFIRALEIDPSITIQKSMLNSDLSEQFALAQRQAKPRAAPPPPPPAPSPAPPPPPRPAPVLVAPVPPPAPPPVTRVPPPPAPPIRRGVLPAEGEVPPPPPPPSATSEKEDEDDSGEPDLPVHINALDCPMADEATPNKGISVRCAAAPELNVAAVVLFYREPGKEDFVLSGMKKTPKGWFVGRIPRRVVIGKSVQLYFEARDSAGKAIASNGRADSPNLILIRDKAAPEARDDEQPDRDSDENPLDRYGNTESPFGKRRWWIGIMAGSGIGYAGGDGPEARTELRGAFLPGNAFAGLGHLAPEIGLQLNPRFALSLQGRHQYIPQAKKYQRYAATGAHSVLARLLVFFTAPRRVRVYGTVMAGGGEGFRLVIYPDKIDPNFKDTVRGGPWLAGLGGGMTVELASAFSLVLEVNVLAGFPHFSQVTDANLGFQFNF